MSFVDQPTAWRPGDRVRGRTIEEWPFAGVAGTVVAIETDPAHPAVRLARAGVQMVRVTFDGVVGWRAQHVGPAALVAGYMLLRE